MPKLAKFTDCTGCLACVDSCSHKAIQIKSVHKLLYPEVESSKCIDCKLCEKSCPIITPVPTNIVDDMRVYGAWAADEQVRIAGASGGACTALSMHFIDKHKGNAVVYGSALENNRAYHKRVDSLEGLKYLTNSKYIQSNTSYIYKQVKDDLRKNKYVLFTGTPCQIAGLYGFLGRKVKDDHLLTIELICAGVMSPEALDIHLEIFNSPRIISFRNKEEGQNYSKSQCTTIEREGQPFRFKVRREDIFYQCFSSCILERPSCFNCKFAKLARVADFTIGDFWGGKKDFKEYEKGVNVVIANNSKADKFLRESDTIELYGSTIGKAISGNPCLYFNKNMIQYHPLVLFPDFFRKMLSRKVWVAIVTNQNPWRYIWGIYRLISIAHCKIATKVVNKKYSYILNEWLSGGGK